MHDRSTVHGSQEKWRTISQSNTWTARPAAYGRNLHMEHCHIASSLDIQCLLSRRMGYRIKPPSIESFACRTTVSSSRSITSRCMKTFTTIIKILRSHATRENIQDLDHCILSGLAQETLFNRAVELVEGAF